MTLRIPTPINLEFILQAAVMAAIAAAIIFFVRWIVPLLAE